jgi:GNAT superfamily N-acetyltransferase
MGFSCGVPSLDRYFREQIGQEFRRWTTVPYVLIAQDETIAGYYTLSAASLPLGELPSETARRLPRYPLVPAFLIGRLALDARHHGKGWGALLLVDALQRCLASGIGGAVVIVDAIDDGARRFYERFGFDSLPSAPNRLFRTMQGIAVSFRDEGAPD